MRGLIASAALLLAAAAPAQDKPAHEPSPGEVVAAAPKADWVAIASDDLLVMDLAPDRDGAKREVVIQLLPPPFSQGWVDNIRTLAKVHWWDGTSVYRVQDDYVAQWGAGTTKRSPRG
jgi:peptidylprolyl isomerase